MIPPFPAPGCRFRCSTCGEEFLCFLFLGDTGLPDGSSHDEHGPVLSRILGERCVTDPWGGLAGRAP